jgi:DNA polymerase III delta prime subunit
MNTEHVLWVERYRPKTVEEAILPQQLKATFQQFVDQKHIPNLLLTGTAGVGKTTIARAMLEQLDCDYIIINGSMNGNIDTLRTEIMSFASSVSFHGGRKYVILDESDYLTAATQSALRNFMEEFSKNCGFILTCNFPNRIIEPIHSRCAVIDFKINNSEIPKLASQFFKRASSILKSNNIDFDPPVVAEVINKHFPDWRRVLNELQRYSAVGKIDSGILINLTESSFKELIQLLKNKKFTEMRKWVTENLDLSPNEVFKTFYDTAVDFMVPKSIPELVLLLSKYQYQSTFAVNQEINTAAFLTEVMMSCEFK